MRVGQSVNQLYVDAHLIVSFLHTAFQDVHYAELLRDLGKIIRRAFEMLCRRAGDDFERLNLGKAGENFILHAFSKVSVLLLIA